MLRPPSVVTLFTLLLSLLCRGDCGEVFEFVGILLSVEVIVGVLALSPIPLSVEVIVGGVFDFISRIVEVIIVVWLCAYPSSER